MVSVWLRCMSILMTHILDRTGVTRTLALAIVLWVPDSHAQDAGASLGREVAIPRHMQDGEEFQTPIPQLIEYGRALFTANWTIQEGAGRPNTKGTGTPLSDATQPLVFPRAFNRISGPDSNSCAGCHNQPYAGGGGDWVPIASAGWSWGHNITSSNNGSTWTLNSGSSANNGASATTTFPSWSNNVGRCVYN